MIRWVTIKKFADETGYTVTSIRNKRRDGVWLEGDIWVKAPDGRLLFNVDRYYAWVEKNTKATHL